MTTPAQVTNQGNFIDDWPIAGPTDEGLRAHDCWFSRNRVPTHPACVDCGEGIIPMWAQENRLKAFGGGLAEQISFGGQGALGFADTVGIAAAAAGDPEIWTKLTNDQQKWVVDTLTFLNNRIYTSTGTTCPTWGPAITLAGGCFQAWFNSVNAGAPIKKLRTDGVFDQDTLDALIVTTQIHKTDFPTPFPGSSAIKKKLSKGAMFGIAAAGAAALGGVVYVATRKPRRRSRRR